MNKVSLTTEYTPHLPAIKKLYRTSFPLAERKPFRVIVQAVAQNVCRVYVVLCGSEFAGFMVAWQDARIGQVVLLDYFAISPTQQGGGIGGQALALLKQKYPASPLLIEIERVDEQPTPKNQTQRLRRRAFYLRNGFESAGIFAKVFGVQMELMSLGGTATASEYINMYNLMSGPGRTRRNVHILNE